VGAISLQSLFEILSFAAGVGGPQTPSVLGTDAWILRVSGGGCRHVPGLCLQDCQAGVWYWGFEQLSQLLLDLHCLHRRRVAAPPRALRVAGRLYLQTAASRFRRLPANEDSALTVSASCCPACKDGSESLAHLLFV